MVVAEAVRFAGVGGKACASGSNLTADEVPAVTAILFRPRILPGGSRMDCEV